MESGRTPADVARAVLAAHGGVVHRVGLDRLERPHDLVLLVAHGVGVEGHRRLHRDEAQELEHVVLHHVAQRARLLVIRPARLHADRLAHRDRHAVAVLAVPQRLEGDVLDGLLAEIVVNPVDLPLAEHPRDQPVQLLGALEIAAERLLDDDPREAVAAPREPRFAQVRDDRRVEARRRRAIEEPVRVALEGLAQARIEGGILGVTRAVGEAGREPLPDGLRGRLDPGEGGDRLAHPRAEGLARHLPAGHREDAERLREGPPLVEAPERGEELALRQISGGPEDHQREPVIHDGRRDLRTCDGARPGGDRQRSCRGATGSGRRARR